MPLRRLVPGFFLILLFVSRLYAADPITSCSQTQENLQHDQLTRLALLETDFMKAAWYYRKSQETVYTPLWEAGVKTRDAYSKSKQAEGSIAFDRYRHEADADHEQAVQAVQRLELNLKNFQENLTHEDSCAGNCKDIFNTETADRSRVLRRLIAGFFKQQQNFSDRIEKHMTESISDHDKFEDRFREHLEPVTLKATSQFLALIRDLQERYQYQWPGGACCTSCAAGPPSPADDAVLKRLKPGGQGVQGVAGEIVNNTGLVKAFKKMDEENGSENN